jgi:inner membrane protein
LDNLTHSLIGAALGQAGLKRRTGLAMPALIIAANIPDIDAACVVYGPLSLAMRRGVSHGPIALAVLPVLLAGALWGYDRWQARRGTRPEARAPVRFGWLLALSYFGTLTHPLFDWFNSYGIRLLEPFSHTWFYGDALFIVDPWILILLGFGIYRSRQRERGGRGGWANPARAALAATAAYVALNLAISDLAVTRVKSDVPYPSVAVANPVPLAFWRREVLWRSADGFYGTIPCDLSDCRRYPRKMVRTNMADPRIPALVQRDPAVRAFLFWSRMPVAELRQGRVVLSDQRFSQSPVRGNFTVGGAAPD